MSSMPKGRSKVVVPGDMVAEIEEYLPGPHVYDESGHLRAASVGTVVRDVTKREIGVKPAPRIEPVRVGYFVTGQVEVAQTNSASISIQYVNGKATQMDFAGVLSLRGTAPRRGERRGAPVKLGDIVRCRVESLMNGFIHLSLDDQRAGVVYAKCSNCGRPLLRAGHKLKCDECGNVEDRKLANDYGQMPIRP